MIRRYKAGDEDSIARIYHDAIMQLTANDYTPEQLRAWANPPVNPEHWKHRCREKQPFVNEREGQVAGFMELDTDGHIDCAFVDPAHVRTRVMSELMEEVKRRARQKGICKLFVEVSKTARPFFEFHGFSWVRDGSVTVRGATLEHAVMECLLNAHKTNCS